MFRLFLFITIPEKLYFKGGLRVNLYIRQRVLSLTDRYDIYDEYGNPYFHVKSEFLTLAAKLHLYDRTGAELYYITLSTFCQDFFQTFLKNLYQKPPKNRQLI